MKAYRKLCLAALLTALLALLCGCSAADFTLPAQVDMQPGDSVALASLVRYQGEDIDTISSAQAAALLADAGELAANVDNIRFDFASTVPGVVEVDDNGVMTAGLTGDATVVVSCPTLDYYAEVQVCVRPLPQSITTDTAAALSPGDTYALTTTVSPGGKYAEVIYTSSNSAVAAVDNGGVITAAAPGEAVITAQVAGSSLAAQCHVSVMGVDTVQSITLTRASAQLAPGQLILLGAQAAGGSGSEAITWASSDEAVATVDASGLVQAVAEGSAVITASAGGKAAACALTVAAPATPETAQPGSTDGEYATEEIALDVYWAATAETAAGGEGEAAATPETAAGDEGEPATAETAKAATAPETAAADKADETAATPETAADKPDEAEKAATPESAAASPADATGTDDTDKAPAAPESAATPETAAANECATPETATPETATPETATPETAGQAMTGEDIIEAISGWINSFFGGS